VRTAYQLFLMDLKTESQRTGLKFSKEAKSEMWAAIKNDPS
jgi:hypothetical protein